MHIPMASNKRMQPDQNARYARILAADAQRYVAGTITVICQKL